MALFVVHFSDEWEDVRKRKRISGISWPFKGQNLSKRAKKRRKEISQQRYADFQQKRAKITLHYIICDTHLVFIATVSRTIIDLTE